MSAENKAFVKRWFDEVWNEGKPGAIEDMMKPHAIVHGLGPEPMRGPEAFKPFHAAYRNAFPDVHVQLEDLVSEGDRVAFRYTVTATHTGDGIGALRPARRSSSRGWASSACATANWSKAGTSSISSA